MAAERRVRIATLVAFLSTAWASAITIDPATNRAIGSAIASKIAYMRARLNRGRVSYKIRKFSLKEFSIIVDTPGLEIHPYRAEFAYNSKIIINNIGVHSLSLFTRIST